MLLWIFTRRVLQRYFLRSTYSSNPLPSRYWRITGPKLPLSANIVTNFDLDLLLTRGCDPYFFSFLLLASRNSLPSLPPFFLRSATQVRRLLSGSFQCQTFHCSYDYDYNMPHVQPFALLVGMPAGVVLMITFHVYLSAHDT